MMKGTLAVLISFVVLQTLTAQDSYFSEVEEEEAEEYLESMRVEHRDHTYAQLDVYRTLHMELNLTVDMEARTLEGYVETKFVKLKPSWMVLLYGRTPPHLTLDVGENMAVTSVQNVNTGEELEFRVVCYRMKRVPVLRCMLEVQEPLKKTGVFTLRIHYKVGERTSGLHFIPPWQTHDKQHYFLVSTTQPSNSRGWIPCQDTPAIKFPYNSTVTVKKPFIALMSGQLQSSETNGDWHTSHFRQEAPVPPYLIAITVADMVSVELRGERESEDDGVGPAIPPIRVWAERTVMEDFGVRDSPLLEFLPRMMDLCEARFGRYVWGRYDVVLCPPGYFVPGMEYPAMNYYSSVLIDFNDLGGQQYEFTKLAAHEMIHSWFGDLVTPKYASDAWLAEGIATYQEYQIMPELYNDTTVGNFLKRTMYTELKTGLEDYKPKDKILTPHLYFSPPFDGFGWVQYCKGSLFMEYLANATSRETVDEILRSYLDRYKYQSVDGADFTHILYDEYNLEAASKMEKDVFVWLERPQTKVPLSLFPSDLYDEGDELYKVLTRNKKRTMEYNMKDVAEAYNSGTGKLAPIAKHMRAQLFYVLQKMTSVATHVKMTEKRTKHWKSLINRLDELFKFTERTTTDPSIFSKWSGLALRFNHTATMAKYPDFLIENGRLGIILSLLEAPADMSLRGEFANTFKTKHYVARLPGYFGIYLQYYIDFFIQFYQPSEEIAENGGIAEN